MPPTTPKDLATAEKTAFATGAREFAGVKCTSCRLADAEAAVSALPPLEEPSTNPAVRLAQVLRDRDRYVSVSSEIAKLNDYSAEILRPALVGFVISNAARAKYTKTIERGGRLGIILDDLTQYDPGDTYIPTQYPERYVVFAQDGKIWRGEQPRVGKPLKWFGDRPANLSSITSVLLAVDQDAWAEWVKKNRVVLPTTGREVW